MKNSVRYFPIIVSGIICLTSFTLQAQGFDASSMAMGGAYAGVARGVDALAWNPANLILPNLHSVELNLLAVNVNIANSSINLTRYNRYFTQSGHKGKWEDQDIRSILDLIPASGLSVSGDVNANVLGLAFLDYGISMEMVGKSRGTIPREVMELILQGNIKELYRFDNLDAQGFSAAKISVALSQKIPFTQFFDVFGIGLAVNYWRGIANAEITQARGYIHSDIELVSSNMSVQGRTAMGGKGFSLDLGTAGIINKKVSVSMVLKNFFGDIRWSKDPKKVVFESTIDSLYLGSSNKISTEPTDTSYTIDSYKTRLPLVFHLGVAYKFNEKILLSMDMEQAFKESMGYSDQAIVSIGTEYSPVKFLPLRAGVCFGGKTGWYAPALGFGLHSYVFNFDFSYMMQNALWPTYSKSVSTALNLKFLF
jgi:hypothetical protein